VETYLTITNAHRKRLNAIHNKQLAPSDAVLVPYDGEDPAAQEMRLWPGLMLQASVTEKAAHYYLKNAVRFRVVAAGGTQCTLVGEDAEEEFTICTSLVPVKFRLVHAITYVSSEARTLQNGIRLTELDHSKISVRRIIVGLGRSPRAVDVQVE